MSIDGKFEKESIEYFSRMVGKGCHQRVDGIDCFSPLSKYPFWRLRLKILAIKGVLIERKWNSMWKSVGTMPSYGISNKSFDQWCCDV